MIIMTVCSEFLDIWIYSNILGQIYSYSILFIQFLPDEYIRIFIHRRFMCAKNQIRQFVCDIRYVFLYFMKGYIYSMQFSVCLFCASFTNTKNTSYLSQINREEAKPHFWEPNPSPQKREEKKVTIIKALDNLSTHLKM